MPVIRIFVQYLAFFLSLDKHSYFVSIHGTDDDHSANIARIQTFMMNSIVTLARLDAFVAATVDFYERTVQIPLTVTVQLVSWNVWTVYSWCIQPDYWKRCSLCAEVGSSPLQKFNHHRSFWSVTVIRRSLTESYGRCVWTISKTTVFSKFLEWARQYITFERGVGNACYMAEKDSDINNVKLFGRSFIFPRNDTELYFATQIRIAIFCYDFYAMSFKHAKKILYWKIETRALYFNFISLYNLLR